ncbi:MAG TPA: hypothetical protein VFG90_08280 [Nitrososphaeraceae archaeon]|nr:hypothetical protein [Nitrososphaeraceae archaeon]
MMNVKEIITFGISIGFLLFLVNVLNDQLQTAQATGCPTNFVAEHVDQALAAYAAGDAKEVKNQLDLAKEAITVASEEKE